MKSILLTIIAVLLAAITVKIYTPTQTTAAEPTYSVVTADVVSHGTVVAQGRAAAGYMLRTPKGLEFVPENSSRLPMQKNCTSVVLVTNPNGTKEIAGAFYQDTL